HSRPRRGSERAHSTCRPEPARPHQRQARRGETQMRAEASITELIVLKAQFVCFSPDELGAARCHESIFSPNLPQRFSRPRGRCTAWGKPAVKHQQSSDISNHVSRLVHGENKTMSVSNAIAQLGPPFQSLPIIGSFRMSVAGQDSVEDNAGDQ